jgi:hypothetical protein
MLGKPPGRPFISYSRKDGAEFAHNLRQSLEQENLSVWQDIVTLEVRQHCHYDSDLDAVHFS